MTNERNNSDTRPPAEGPIVPATAPSPGSGRWMIWILALLAMALFLYVNRPVKSALPWERDVERGLARAKETNRCVLLEFQTLGCPACEWMDQNVFNGGKVASALSDWVILRVDGAAEPRLSMQYGVEAFPTFLVLAPDGTTLSAQVGAVPEDAFIAFLKSAQAKSPPSATSKPMR